MLETAYRIIKELDPVVPTEALTPFQIDYMLSEWQAAYLYPNKTDSSSPIDNILLRTIGKAAIEKGYLAFNGAGRSFIDFQDTNLNYERSLSYFPEDDNKALGRCLQIKEELIMANLSEPLEFVIMITHGFFAQKIPTLFDGKGGYADYCCCSCV